MNASTALGLDALVATGRCSRDVPIAGLTTYKFGGPAAYFSEPVDRDELFEVVSGAVGQGVEVYVVGRGSNLVVSDAGYDGLIVHPIGSFLEFEVDDYGDVDAGAAVPLPRLARETVRAGRGGLEWFVGIPGSVGGAVRMNAGGHGSETAEWLLTATVLDIGNGTTRMLTPGELDLSYRHSNLGVTDIVMSATFRTIEREPEVGNQILREVTQWRKRHQPGGTLNAGSVFKNPEGDSAGRIIDSLGLKGFRCGGAAVSERHANFFVAADDATAQDIYDLVGSVRRRVGEATGMWLEPEIRFVGRFVDPSSGAVDTLGRPR